MSTPYTEAEVEAAAEAVCPSPQNHYDGEFHERDCTPIALAVLNAVAGSIAARALLEAADSGDFVGPIADMLAARADRVENGADR
jgi:hypothetical protein